MKTCPFCEEEIQDEAIKCRYCGEFFDKIDDEKCNEEGDNFFEEGKYKEALNKYKKAIELNDKNPEYYNNIGVSYYNLEDYREALKYYRKAIALDPENQDYIDNENECLEELYGENKEAEDQINIDEEVENNKGNNIFGNILVLFLVLLFIGIFFYIFSGLYSIVFSFLKKIFTEKGILQIINAKHGIFFYIIITLGIIFNIIYKISGLLNIISTKDGDNKNVFTIIYLLISVLPIIAIICIFIGLGLSFSFTGILNYLGTVELGFLLILLISEYIPFLGIIGVFLPLIYYIYIIINFLF